MTTTNSLIKQIQNKKLVLSVVAISLVLVSGNEFLKRSRVTESEAQTTLPNAQIAVQTVGGSTLEFENTTWPGEIISENDIPVYPLREGSLQEWKVRIGQTVTKGQVLAKLSAPPADSDQISGLAMAAENLARAKAKAVAESNYAEANKKQLLETKRILEKSTTDSLNLISNDANSEKNKTLTALNKALEAAEEKTKIKNQSVTNYSRQSLRVILPLITGILTDPILSYKTHQYNFNLKLKPGLGDNSYAAQANLISTATEALKSAAADDEGLGAKTLQFLESADTLVANSVMLEDSGINSLEELRMKISEERKELTEQIETLEEIKAETATMKAELQDKTTEYAMSTPMLNKELAEKLKEINEKILEVEKEKAMAEAESKAAAAAYATIANATLGNLEITAPKNGTVGGLNKNIGDFIKPEDAVASINSGSSQELFVRFRIPLGSVPPEVGSELTMSRPGFPLDKKKIKVTGVGVSLGQNGYFIAEADTLESVNWPARSQVRISGKSNGSITVPLDAIQFEETGKPFVWLVNESGYIRKQEVKTGKTVSGNIEIVEGLETGFKFVERPTGELKDGQKIDEIKTTSPQTNEAPDGHNHEH